MPAKHKGAVILQRPIGNAWKKSIEEAGDTFITYDPKIPDHMADVVLTWGQRWSPEGIRCAPVHVVIEKGFLGHRATHRNFTFSAIGGNGVPIQPFKQGMGEKFYPLIKPSKKPSKRVLVLGQIPRDLSLLPLGGTPFSARRRRFYKQWIATTIRRWQDAGYEVGYKPHPLHKKTARWVEGLNVRDIGTLPEAFEWASVAVAFNSNSLVEAACHGLAVAPCHVGSLAWPIRSSMGNLRYPNQKQRREWVDRVASYQIHSSTFSNGKALEILKNVL